jgi:nucleoside-diphosphate-sugar epimerase
VTAGRILFAGATGVLGRATLPHLRGRDVVGVTRSPEKVQLLHSLGAAGEVCDVFDYDGLERLMRRVRPHTVVNFVTDLASGSTSANSRARREGGRNLVDAAADVGAARLVVESVAFPLDDEGALAVEELERTARGSPADVLILRFGRLWGPGTFHDSPPQQPAVHVDKAGAEAARLLARARPGTYVVT